MEWDFHRSNFKEAFWLEMEPAPGLYQYLQNRLRELWLGAASALPCTCRLGGRGDQGLVTDGPTQNHARWIKDDSPQTQQTFTKMVQLSIANSTFYWSLLSFRIKTCSPWISSFLSCGSYLRKELDVNWPLNIEYGKSFYWGPLAYLPSIPGDFELIRLTSLWLRIPRYHTHAGCLQLSLRSLSTQEPRGLWSAPWCVTDAWGLTFWQRLPDMAMPSYNEWTTNVENIIKIFAQEKGGISFQAFLTSVQVGKHLLVLFWVCYSRQSKAELGYPASVNGRNTGWTAHSSPLSPDQTSGLPLLLRMTLVLLQDDLASPSLAYH